MLHGAGLGGWHHPQAALTQLVGGTFCHRTAEHGPPQYAQFPANNGLPCVVLL